MLVRGTPTSLVKMISISCLNYFENIPVGKVFFFQKTFLQNLLIQKHSVRIKFRLLQTELKFERRSPYLIRLFIFRCPEGSKLPPKTRVLRTIRTSVSPRASTELCPCQALFTVFRVVTLMLKLRTLSRSRSDWVGVCCRCLVGVWVWCVSGVLLCVCWYVWWCVWVAR